MSKNNTNLNNGIYLESSNCFLKWRIPYKCLVKLGNPEVIEHSNKRTDLIWKNEKILNGINVDLVIMRWSGIFQMNRKFNYAFAYLSQDDFNSCKKKLDSELGLTSKYKRKSDLEYRFIWDLDFARISLKTNDRFGPYWTIEIRYKSLLDRILT